MKKIALIHAQFLSQAGYAPEVMAPRSFNEKIQWLKLFWQDPLLTRCSDKIAMKAWAREQTGHDVCVPTLAAYRTAEAFDPAALPGRFVLKSNWGSGHILVCRDRNALNLAATRALLRRWLQPGSNHYFYSYEWGYRDIAPQIVAEPMLGEPHELTDYKFMCFGGEPRCVFAATNRTRGLNVDFFTPAWEPLPFTRQFPRNPAGVSRPEKLDEMLLLARQLAAGFPFVRVDFYLTADRIYLGEMTFYPGNGMEPFTPREWDFELGRWLVLPEHALYCAETGLPQAKVPIGQIGEMLDKFDLKLAPPQARAAIRRRWPRKLGMPWRALRRLFRGGSRQS